MADKKINEVSTLTDFDYALVVKGNDVAKVSKQQLASIVGGLIGNATAEKNGLMPNYYTFLNSYNSIDNGYILVAKIREHIGFVIFVSVIKNHEYAGNSVVLLTGFEGGVNSTTIRKGGFLRRIYRVQKDGYLYIYVQTASYVNANAFCIARTDNDIDLSSAVIASLPDGSTEIVTN